MDNKNIYIAPKTEILVLEMELFMAGLDSLGVTNPGGIQQPSTNSTFFKGSDLNLDGE
ncbi:MAG: hypothetical protein KBH23_04165 [Bacteroidaceae bacterium]|nr:hypothetical protein [Bacteroidaceae bacterium]MBP9637335.1 hypothetical protein [Bacteroidaceae bacterium]